jgi:hypothetical protein
MRSRFLVAVIAVLALMTTVGLQPAAAGASTSTVTTPALTMLYPTSATKVAAGSSVSLAYGFRNVLPHPSATLHYKSESGFAADVQLNVFAGTLTVPATWAPGTYRLKTVTVSSIDGSWGKHSRAHRYVGAEADGTTSHAYCNISFWRLDLRVK